MLAPLQINLCVLVGGRKIKISLYVLIKVKNFFPSNDLDKAEEYRSA